MTAQEVLDAFAADGELADTVLGSLNLGFWEEWDCDLLTGVVSYGFGPDELAIAARTSQAPGVGGKAPHPLQDHESRHCVRVLIRTKNAGTVRDLTKDEVQELLRQDIEQRIGAYRKISYILEVLVK